MSEQCAPYVVKEPNPSGIPARWLRFLYRMAGLERGKVYNMVVIVPDKETEPVKWTFVGNGKLENGG